MNIKIIIQTILARFVILALNFGLMIFTVKIWGSEGKGIISLLIADLSFVIFVTNAFAGGSVSYFASRFRIGQIMLYAYGWSVAAGIIIPVCISFFRDSGYLFYLILLSVSSALLSANINMFIGRDEIRLFNRYTILQLALHFIFIAGIIYLLQIFSVEGYFIAQIIVSFLLFASSSLYLWRNAKWKDIKRIRPLAKAMFTYGWKTQLSSFLQFLNNRISYYVLEFFKGVSSVGIYSVGVAFSEAIWSLSRSLGVVLYAKLLNSDGQENAVSSTKASLKIGFIFSSVFAVALLLIPANMYVYIFGSEFYRTKQIILLFAPGIIAVALGHIVGNYFSAVNKLRILNVKSLLGLFFTVPALLFVVPRWGILGAAAVASCSYILSTGVLLWTFYQETHLQLSDFFITRSEVKALLQKIRG